MVNAPTHEVDIRRDLPYAIHGGETLTGTLYLPSDPGPHPLVICVHGGGWQLRMADN